MIIDCDTHMSPYKKLPESIDAPEWNDRLAQAGVDRAICWMMQQHLDEPDSSNRYIYESSKTFPRMIPFGWVMIPGRLTESLDEVKRCFDEYGFYGIKINGSQNQHNIDDEDSLKVIDLVAKAGKIIAFHVGAEAPEFTDPQRALRIAGLCPELRILMVHMGGVVEPDMSEKVIQAAQNSPNMMLVGSAIPTSRVANGIRKLGRERILFGSDHPYKGPVTDHLEAYRAMLKDFDGETADAVMGLNAKRFLGL